MLQLNYKKYGQSNTKLIILHGFLGSLDNWHTLATEWAKNDIEVYTIDQRNHGKSPHTEHHTIDLMVEDVKDFMEQQGITKTNMMGHSMGGKVAMQFALTYPELLDKLIVVDIAPRSYNHGHDDIFNAIHHVSLETTQTRKEVEEAMMPYLGDFGTRQFIMKGLERSDDGKYHWKFNVETLDRDYENVLEQTFSDKQFLGDVLFLKGSLSLYIQEKDFAEIKKLFPNSRIQTIENAGHWLHADKPQQFFDAVKIFLFSN